MDLPMDPRDVLHILFEGYSHQGGTILEKLKICKISLIALKQLNLIIWIQVQIT